MDKELIESYLAGVISGDGNLQNYFIQIDGDNSNWLELINRLFQLLFRKKGKITKRSEKSFRLYINCKKIVKMFNEKWTIPIGNKSYSIKPPLEKLTNNLMKVYYLIGWLDAEGTVEDWKKDNIIYKRIQFKTKSKEIRDFLSEILQSNEIEVSNYKDCEDSFRIQIARKSSIQKFKEKLCFLHPEKRTRLLKWCHSTGSKAET